MRKKIFRMFRRIAINNYLFWCVLLIGMTPIIWICYVFQIIGETCVDIWVNICDKDWGFSFETIKYSNYRELKDNIKKKIPPKYNFQNK